MMDKVKWFYEGQSYNSRREIQEKFGFPTCVWHVKIRDKEIIKLIIKDKSDENNREERERETLH